MSTNKYKTLISHDKQSMSKNIDHSNYDYNTAKFNCTVKQFMSVQQGSSFP